MTTGVTKTGVGGKRQLSDGWRWVRLDQALELADPGIWGEPDSDNGMRILRSTNFRNDGTFDLSDLAVRAIPAEKRDQKVLLPGDIVLERSGGGPKQPVGRVCFFEGDKRDHTFGNFCQRLRARSGICDARFLFWHLYLFHMSGQTQLYQTQTTGIRNLEYKRYLAHELPLPPLSEQQRIASILSEQMAVVERARAAAEARLEAAKALPAAYLRAVFNSTEAQQWPSKRLGEVCEFLDSRRVPVNETERVKRIAGKKRPDLFPYYGANGQVGWIDGYLFDEPLILLAEDGGNFGSQDRPIAYAVSGRYWVNNHAHVLRPRNTIDFNYCLHALRIRPDVGGLVSGSTRAKLNQEIASSIPVPLPPLAEQRRIATFLSEQVAAVERARKALDEELDTIDRLPAALLRRAFSGEL